MFHHRPRPVPRVSYKGHKGIPYTYRVSTVSELLRDAIRLYMEEREWRRRERLERLRTRQTGHDQTEGGEADE